MSARPQHIHGAHAAAVLRRGQLGIAATAYTNNAATFEFWKGYTEAARDLINGVGALAAAKDELTGSDAQTDLQAAGACLPERTKGLTLAQVREFLAAQGIEVAPDAISHTDIGAGEIFENNVVPRVDCDDEHPVARVHMRHSSDSHGLSSTNQGEASLDQPQPTSSPAKTFEALPLAASPLSINERARWINLLDPLLSYAGRPGDWGRSSKLGRLTMQLMQVRADMADASTLPKEGGAE
ncbi:hypothetical protein IB236_17570 [Acidovorax sp. ACV02]|uniref:hypothetical protein n=1 Tax=Acidovorax sp. ACV02 TaxID=2769310 RepID=UPI00177E0EF4|nr:hypothetical protein [Acidovorax sp. ACV02]MBD9407158.1 hypothetical protein [Acidovorax sp. ACV02]